MPRNFRNDLLDSNQQKLILTIIKIYLKIKLNVEAKILSQPIKFIQLGIN